MTKKVKENCRENLRKTFKIPFKKTNIEIY